MSNKVIETDTDELADIIQGIANNIKREDNETDFSFPSLSFGTDELDEEDDPESPTLNFNDLLTQISSDDDISDIFTEIGGPLAEQGIVVKYRVTKNGQIDHTQEHPYSMEELHKTLGRQGGRVKIVAYLPDSIVREHKVKPYIKAQSCQFGPYKGSFSLDDDESNKKPDEESTTSKMFKDMLDSQAQEKEIRRQEMNDERLRRREEVKDQKANQSEMLLMMAQALKPKDNSALIASVIGIIPAAITMFQNKDKDTSQFDFLKMMMDTQNTNRQEMMSLFEKISGDGDGKLEALMSQIQAASSNNEEKLTSFQIMEMMNKAKGEGFDQYVKMDEMATKKAESMNGTEKPSLYESALSTIFPLIGQSMAMKSAQEKTAVIPTATKLPYQETTIVPAKRVVQPKPRPTRPQRRPQPSAPSYDNYSVLDEIGLGSNESYAPETFDSSEELEPEFSSDIIEEEAPVQTVTVDLNNREQIQNITLPVLVEAITTLAELPVDQMLKQTCDKCIQALVVQGIDPATVKRDFGIECIEETIKAFAMDEHHAKLLRDFHNELIRQIETRHTSS